MKKLYTNNNLRLIGLKNFKGQDRRIDYYLITTDNNRLYAFTNVYTNHSYDLCKSGIRIDDLISKKCRDEGVMRLVRSANRMIPYLVELYGLPVAA